ncbi:rasGAP-activating-like protein 1 isoform 2-T2 [Vipera latastei]
MARSTALHFRVVEGRDLPAKDVSGTSDPYCIIKVDNEIVARTATVWKNLNPFWGEEYTLHLPTGFHNLSFYVLDEDTIGHDDVIGKISLSKDEISSQPRGIDSWINLSQVDPNEEVQGEISLELQVVEEAHQRLLCCHVLEARDLAPRDLSGTSDPFARILFNGQVLETAIIKKTRFPRWEEMLEFVLEEGADSETPLVVEVWDWDMVGKNDFLGQVKFCLGSVQKTLLKGWFRLLPLANTGEDAGGKLGQLRLQVRLAEDRILPSSYYRPLIDLLVESVLCLPEEADDLTPLALLEEVCLVESRQDVSTKLVKIFLGQGLVIPFLDYLNFHEISKTTDPNTLFRSNSLASKSMEQFMKIVGMPYLHEVLKVIIHRIFEEKKYVELDPCKIEPSRAKRISFKGSLSEAQIRESSLEVLKGYLGDIVEAIVGSTEKCPSLMRVAFKQLYKRVEQRFEEAESQEAKYIAISGFLFLRFFAPAILTPKLFNLRDQHADTQTSRTLLLLAKAVQSIGNLGLQLGHGKEQWMQPLHPFILTSIGRVQEFLDGLIDVDMEMGSEKQPWTLFHSSAIIKEGYLQKRKAESVHLVSRFTFKKRYFWLSHESFSYSKSPEWQNVNELNQWLSAIRKATISNECMLPFCHPGAFRSNRWTCCLQTDRAVRGCSRTHSAVTLGDWSDPLDPDAEAQMVYKQFLLHKDKLREKYREISKTEAAQEQSNTAKKASEKNQRRLTAAARLLEVIQGLEQAHRAFEHQEDGETAGTAALPPP